MTDPCTICGAAKDEHHEYQAPGRASASCVCDAETWADPTKIPAVCPKYRGDGEGYCATCAHDRKCHEAMKEL